MKKRTRIALIVAACLCGAGFLLTFMASAMIGFDFTRLDIRDFTDQTYEVEPIFENITIKTSDSDVRILPSEDGSCRVVCRETAEMKHFVSVKGDELTISQKYSGKWYEQFKIMTFAESQSVTVYLPEKEYRYLDVKTISGSFDASEDLTFENIKFRSTSGDMDCAAQAIVMDAGSTSGELTVSGVQHAYSVELSTTSGDIKMQDFWVDGSLNIQTTSGEVTLSKGYMSCTDDILSAMAHESVINTTSGDVNLDYVDFVGDLLIRTVSGEVSGVINSSKEFFVQTVSGDVSVPQSEDKRPDCKIVTTSGDVHLRIKEK